MTILARVGVRKFFIQDYKIGRWAAVEKYQIIYNFYKEACEATGAAVLLLIEVVQNQAEAFQYIRDTHHDVLLRQVNPKGRGTGEAKEAKEWRITNNFVIELEFVLGRKFNQFIANSLGNIRLCCCKI